MSHYRSHYCSELGKSITGQAVTLSGWVHRRRDHGSIMFVDLRDRSGLCQVVIPADLRGVDKIRSEFVLRVTGQVVARPEGMINRKIQSGEIEIHATHVEILSAAEVPPFSLEDDNDNVNENTRLKYRYLDLRRPQLQKNFLLRHKLLQSTRRYFDEQGFLEIETPILYKSTPEGARDYLVPSRVHPGEFFALPQSPQTLKQLLMISGMDRYVQIARCFRDEDLRADRQPEFTQVDLEASFLTQDEFLKILEGYIQRVWKDCLGISVSAPFPRMSYAQAMSDYGSDKPDTRFDMKLVDVSRMVENSDFKIFASTVKNGGSIVGLPVRGKELNAAGKSLPEWSRKFFDQLNTVVAAFGLKGVAWIRVEAGGWTGSVAKFFKPEEQTLLNSALGTSVGDFVFFGAERPRRCLEAMGSLRLHLAKELGLIQPDVVSEKWNFVWVTEFPLFEYDEDAGRLFAAHHPFTRPMDEDRDLLFSGEVSKMKTIRAQAYDLALNGFEVGGGSLRIYDSQMQAAMFKALGLTLEEAEDKFGFFMEALKYGTPPHGGLAFGVDRLAMLMAGATSLRDVIAFPKTARAQCLMSACPSVVAPEQMAELRLSVVKSSDS